MFIALALRGIDLESLTSSFEDISLPFILLSVIMNLFSCWVRSLRFREMTKPIQPVSLSVSYTSVMVGLMVNNVLPFRLGELTRGHVLKRHARMSFTTSMGLIVIERIMDVLSLLIIFGVLVFLFPFPEWVRRGGWTVLGIVVIVAAVLSYTARRPGWMLTFIDAVVSRLSMRLAVRLKRMAGSFAEGVRFEHAAAGYAKIGFQTVVIWASYMMSVWAMFPAMGFDERYGLGFFEGIVAMVFSTFAILIPSAPGYVGTFHEVAKQSLMFFRVPREPALALAIVFHAVHYVAITGIGLVLFFKSQLNFGETLKAVESDATAEVQA